MPGRFIPKLGSMFRKNGVSGTGTRAMMETLSKADFWANPGGDIVCPAGIPTLIGSYEIPEQVQAMFGYGNPGVDPADLLGFLYMALLDNTVTNSALVDGGKITLQSTQARGMDPDPVISLPAASLHGSLSDRRLKQPLPLQELNSSGNHKRRGPNDKLQIFYESNVATTLVETAIGTTAGTDLWQIPVTFWQ